MANTTNLLKLEQLLEDISGQKFDVTQPTQWEAILAKPEQARARFQRIIADINAQCPAGNMPGLKAKAPERSQETANLLEIRYIQ